MYKSHGILLVFAIALLWSAGVLAENTPKASHGMVYVSAAWQQQNFTTPDRTVGQFIVSRLVIRNTDMGESITVNSVRFFGPDGDLVHEFVTDPITLSPLASTSFLANRALPIPAYPFSGGRPCFIVEWVATTKVNKPIIENLHTVVQGELDGASLHSLSITPGQEIR